MSLYKLAADASVRNARELHGVIGRMLAGEKELVLDLSELKRIDLALAQIIISAGREARRSGAVLKLRSASPAVRKQLALCGLVR